MSNSDGERFPELTSDEIDKLPPDVRQTYEYFSSLSPEERALLHVQSARAQVIMDTLQALSTPGGLAGVWSNFHPALQREMADRWAEANRAALERDGYTVEGLAAELVSKSDRHELWNHFDRAQTKAILQTFPDGVGEHLGTSTQTREVAPGQFLVHVIDKRELRDGENWDVGESVHTLPAIVESDSASEWKIRTLG